LLRGGGFEINQMGEIWQDGALVDRLQVFEFDNPEGLERSGFNYFLYEGPEGSVKAREFAAVRQGFLEGSNVNAIQNITSMIISHRSLEAYQKAIQTYDRVMDRTANSIGEI